MIKYVLFTHTDLDGAGCRVIFELFMNKRGLNRVDDYIICNANISELYNTVNDVIDTYNISDDTEIIFADICCGKELMTTLTKRFKHIKVFDHHVTNYWVNEFPCVESHVYSSNADGRLESGTSIMWSYYRNELNTPNIIAFVNAVRSYDTFEFKTISNKNAVILNKYLSIIGMESFCDAQITFLEGMGYSYEPCKCYESVVDTFEHLDLNEIPYGNDDVPIVMSALELFIVESALAIEEEKINMIIMDENDNVFKFSIKDNNGKSYIVFNLIPGINMSDLAVKYLNLHPEYDVFVWFDLNRKCISFRSISDNVNVSEIASLLNGGGHPKASGAQINHATNELNLIEMAMKAIITNERSEKLQKIIDIMAE